MLNLIVLGIIPGTNVVITLNWLIFINLTVFSIWLLVHEANKFKSTTKYKLRSN